MLKIAIVENEEDQAGLLRGYAMRYAEEKGIKCGVKIYSNGLDFISDYKPGFDAVFMDIKMPLVDGMEAAERLRRIDGDVLLIFVTNMAQLAIKGYKVNAMDFIVKPVPYFDFALEMDKIRREHDRRAEDFIWVKSAGVLRRIDFSSICYIEIIMHDVYVHTECETVNFRGSLKDHMKYERKLNRYLKSYLASGNVRLNVRFTTDVLGELRARHDEYEEMEHSPETDTSCILSALALVYLLGYVPAPALLSSAV